MSTPLTTERLRSFRTIAEAALFNPKQTFAPEDAIAIIDELVVARAALGELVRLKSMMDSGTFNIEVAKEWIAAWAAARAALGRDAVQTGGGQQCET